MGMTIDEHITQLKKIKPFHNGSYGASINYAIETMRKYRQIEQAYSDYLETMNPETLADLISTII